MTEKLVKSLGCWYDATLKDANQDQLRKDTVNGLESINKSLLPGRLKLWCFQFGQLLRLMWPRLERLVSLFAKKWLGLPRCFSCIDLDRRGILELSVSSLLEEFKWTRVRLEMILSESCDPCVAQTAPILMTGTKWTPVATIHQAKSALVHWGMVGNVQQDTGGLGLGWNRPSWHKAGTSQLQAMVHHQEQATRCAKAFSGKTGKMDKM